MGLSFHEDIATIVSVYRDSVSERALEALEDVYADFIDTENLEEHLYSTSVDDTCGDIEGLDALSEFCEEIRTAYPTASYFRIITH